MSDLEHIIAFWQEASEKDRHTMLNLFKSKDYSWSLFLGHLVLEKLLKAHYVKHNNAQAIFTHDLLRLSGLSGIEFGLEQQDWLDHISTFNINARYDSYKQDFYKRCTKDYTATWLERIEILRIWLIEAF